MVLRKLTAFFILDFLEELSYPLAFIWRCGRIFFRLVAFYFLGQLVGQAGSSYLSAYGGGYFPFVMVGLALASFQDVALTSIARKIYFGMYSGTLEAMLVTPTSLPAIVFCSVLYQFFSALLEILLYLGFSVWIFKISLAQANLPATAVLLILALLAHLPLGIMSAGFLLAFKRDDPVTAMVGHLSALLGGVYFPVQILPHWLGTVSLLLPFTHALEGLRQAVLNGWGLRQLSTQITILAAFAVVLLPLSLAVFAWAVRQAKRLGTLSQY
jgi:ABC-2 type transport system permease protein